MPISLTNYTDLSIPTPNGDGTTYGTIINQWFEDLTTKIDALTTRISDAQTQLGSTTTVGSILYNINQVNTINALLEADGVTSDKVLTGTPRTLLPDPLGSYTNATTFPAFTGSGEALNGITPPTTEAEVLSFDYAAFATALNGILSTIATRVAQTEADIASARVNICKTKKYTNARQGGGTVERYWSVSNIITVRFTYNGTTLVGSTGDSVTFSIGVSGSSQNFANFYPGLTNAGYATDQQSRTYYNTAGGADYTVPDVNSYNIGDSLTVVNVGFFQSGNVSFLFDSLGFSNGQWTGNWIQPYTLSQYANFDVPFSTYTLSQRTVYSVTGLSECDTNPGGPHFTSGSYS